MFFGTASPKNFPEAQFDFIWAFNVMIHMSDPIARETFSLVERCLQKEGVFYVTVYLGHPVSDRHRQGFPVVYRPLLFYEDLAKEHNLSLTVLGTLGHLHYVNQNGRRGEMVVLEVRPTSR